MTETAKNEESAVKSLTIRVAASGVMTALVSVATLIIQIPNPATRGYINVGDAMIFVSAFTFGPIVGGFAGGVGSALTDIISGYAYFAPFTLVVKGVEGFLAGVISDGKSVKRDAVALIIGGSEMVLGYFVCEAFIMGYGMLAALTEVPGNIFQILAGGIIGIPASMIIRRRVSILRGVKSE